MSVTLLLPFSSAKSRHTSNGGNGLEVAGGAVLQGNGDGTSGLRPGEGERLAGEEGAEDTVGELDLSKGASDEGSARSEEGSETHFDGSWHSRIIKNRLDENTR